MNKNTELFIETIDSLAGSQGFYSRLSRNIHDAINNDSLEVILYLEV